MKLLYEELSYKIRGLFFTIYNEIGPGFKERAYLLALTKLLEEKSISYEIEKPYSIHFRGINIGMNKVDLVVDGKIIVEVKATDIPNRLFEKQLLSYLKSTGLSLGFLVNFGTNSLYIKRYVNEESAKSKSNTLIKNTKNPSDQITVIKKEAG